MNKHDILEPRNRTLKTKYCKGSTPSGSHQPKTLLGIETQETRSQKLKNICSHQPKTLLGIETFSLERDDIMIKAIVPINQKPF